MKYARNLKAKSDDSKDMFHLCEFNLNLFRAAYSIGSYLADNNVTNVYKHSAFSEEAMTSTKFTLVMY